MTIDLRPFFSGLAEFAKHHVPAGFGMSEGAVQRRARALQKQGRIHTKEEHGGKIFTMSRGRRYFFDENGSIRRVNNDLAEASRWLNRRTKRVKGLILSILTLCAVSAQTTPPPAAEAAAATLNAITMPNMLAAGLAGNQFSGYNAFASAIMPLSQSQQLFYSATVDIFPIKTTIDTKSGYLFQTSARAGVHRAMINTSKFMGLIGADLGYAFGTGAAVANASASGVSGAVTLTAVYQINSSWAVMMPIRALYMPAFKGWNPIVEFGIVYKPRKQ